MPDLDPQMTPGEVARIFGVNPTTVSDWADQGRLPFTRTPGGHRRFRKADVDAFIASLDPEPERAA